MMPLVIKCSNHQYAPYSFLCCHLLDNPTMEWVPMEVDDGREVENDWLCKDCYDLFQTGDDLADQIVPICINCVRHLRGEE